MGNIYLPSSIYETMAVLILRITGEKMPVTTDIVARFQAIYEEMKRHHWWLTGNPKGPHQDGEAQPKHAQPR